MDRRAWTLLLTLAAIWGASYMLIKIGLRDLSPPMVAWLRVALAAAVIAPIAAARGALRGLGGALGMLFLVAAVQVAAPFTLIALGEQEVSSALAGILIATAPIFTALLAIRFDHEERSQGLRLVGIVIGIAGVGLLFGVDLSGSGSTLLGGLAVVGAGFGYAVGGFLIKRGLATVEPLGLTVGVMAAAAALLLPAALATAPTEAPEAGPLAAVAALGAIGTGIAFIIFFGLIARVGPAKTYLVSYLAPGFAVVYGSVLLDEAISAATVAGLGLILAGSWLGVEGRLGRRRSVRRPPAKAGRGDVAIAPELATQSVEER